uniref:Uncharacterized protein n=1 Tax=Panagrolaimus sp. PS1159 TaxID=55785 RepID=A0AC35G183_9BILA
MDNLDALSSDGDNYEQYGNGLKFVGNEREGIELELEKKKKLMFKFCSYGCMKKTVVACFDSANPNLLARGDCGPGQCEFKAGVSEKDGQMLLWFKDDTYNKRSDTDSHICATATMAFPVSFVTLTDKFLSCEPLKHDGNVVKLYVKHVEPGCPFYVENAKKWTPPPPATTAQNSSGTTVPNQTTFRSSEANTALWIGIGVGIFIFLIVIIGFGYCCYRTQIQKQPLFGNKKDVQQKVFLPEASKKARAAENEKAADEEQVLKAEPTKVLTKEEVVAKLQPSKEATAAKEKQAIPAKKKTPKEKKAPIVVPKPSKEITQEDNPPPAKKVSAEPTLEDPTTEASVVQKSVVQQKQYHNGNPPRVYVPKNVIHPEPKSINAPKSGSLKTGKKDSLSGRHELRMEGMVESGPEQVKRRDTNVGLLNKETKEKLEKFYPRGPVRKRSNARTFDPVRAFDCREIEILCCARISIMFKTIEMLIDDAIKALTERAEKYLRSKSTPEYVKSFAFGNVFRDIIDAQTRFHERFSIPFLFSVVLQRRYSATNRRKAFTWIRRELLIIEKEFTADERSGLPYPICAIEAACKMDFNGFKSVALLDSLSGDDDDETQGSTRASEKLSKN